MVLQLQLQPQFVSQPVLQPKLPPQPQSRMMISRMIQIQQPPLVEQNMCLFLSPRRKSRHPGCAETTERGVGGLAEFLPQLSAYTMIRVRRL